MPLNIQVGQQWRTRGGDVRTVAARDPETNIYVWDMVDGGSVDANGRHLDFVESPSDLVELFAPGLTHSQRLSIAAPIYAAMLTTADSVAPDDAVQALHDLARRALSHADILIEEANRAA